jgi:hypothetical protein
MDRLRVQDQLERHLRMMIIVIDREARCRRELELCQRLVAVSKPKEKGLLWDGSLGNIEQQKSELQPVVVGLLD